ncbi:LppU/SCO3897 family protein [Streptomyces sp. NPDC059597]|uniref:LppU/SCO3897 family protein n=1 Tax=Streptomyces sp. NPDC059597 TaxID=3346879 RepID=UPI0036BC23C1
MPRPPSPGDPNVSRTPAQIRRNRLIFLAVLLVLAGLVTFSALGPYDTKDQSATLKPGDCFQNTGTDTNAKAEKLDCTDPHADYKVLKMDKDAVVDTFACSDVPDTTGSLTQLASGKTFVVCFKKNDEKDKK